MANADERPPYKVLSLFSGAMGLDQGVDSTGRFRLLAAVELEEVYCQTIRANIAGGRLPGDLLVKQGDIRTVDASKLRHELGLERGELDLLMGGPPCQSFSTAGKRGTVQDPRGTLLWEYLRFVREFQPKFFLMENVRGLLSAAVRHRHIAERPEKGGPKLEPEEKPGSVVRLFARDLQALDGARYHMDCFEVNAVNYGAPQIRERAIFIGNRFGMSIDFPNPTHGPPKRESRQATLAGWTGQALLPWQSLGEALTGLNDANQVLLDFSPRKKRYLEMIPPGSNWRSLPIEVQKESMGKAWMAKGGRSGWWRRLSMDLPSPTLVTLPNHAGTSLCHPTETRVLSLREYARIQEFPDDWVICGKPSEQYAQVGNAVPVRLGHVAGSVIASALDNVGVSQAMVPAEGDFRVVYVQSHVRTRQWFKDGEAVVWEDGEENGGARYAAPKTLRKSKRILGVHAEA